MVLGYTAPALQALVSATALPCRPITPALTVHVRRSYVTLSYIFKLYSDSTSIVSFSITQHITYSLNEYVVVIFISNPQGKRRKEQFMQIHTCPPPAPTHCTPARPVCSLSLQVQASHQVHSGCRTLCLPWQTCGDLHLPFKHSRTKLSFQS